ncbi:MAG: queuosine precursor transporter [Gemmataceae bacterium]
MGKTAEVLTESNSLNGTLASATSPAGMSADGQAGSSGSRQFRFYDILMVLSATVAVCCNMLALKVTQVGPLTFGAAVVFFPITYILGDVLTEVYGFRRARRVIWVSFGAMLFTAFMSWVVLTLPPAPGDYPVAIDQHYQAVFGITPRIFVASLIAFLVGDYLNSVVLARRKVIDRGRSFWKRAIFSTVVGQAADTVLFYPLAFAGVWSWDLIGTIMATHYTLKVGIEVIGLPVTYRVAAFLKRAEGVDVYDRDTSFNPFGLDVDPEGRS